MSLAINIQSKSNFEKIETFNNVSPNYYEQAKIVFLISVVAQSCLALLAFSFGFPISVTAYKIFTAVCVNTISCVINNTLCFVLKGAYRWIANDAEMRKIWNNIVDRHNCFFINDSKYPSSMKMSIALSVISGMVMSCEENFALNEVMMGDVAILSTLVFSATQVLSALLVSPQESINHRRQFYENPSSKRENILEEILNLKENFSSDLQDFLETERKVWLEFNSSLKTNIAQAEMKARWLNAILILELALEREKILNDIQARENLPFSVQSNVKQESEGWHSLSDSRSLDLDYQELNRKIEEHKTKMSSLKNLQKTIYSQSLPNVKDLSEKTLLVKEIASVVKGVIEDLLSNPDVPVEKRLIFRINMENEESDFFQPLTKLIVLNLIMEQNYPTFVDAFKNDLSELREKFLKLPLGEQEIIKKGIWTNSRVENLSENAADIYKYLGKIASENLLQKKDFNQAINDYLKSRQRKI